VCRLIQSGVESGAKLLLDGRNIVVCYCMFVLLLGPATYLLYIMVGKTI
jgi:hypothetical protein